MRPLDDSRGFTLLEILVSIGLLTGGLLTLALAMTMAAQTSARARETTRATLVATQKLEELRGTPWDALADGHDAPLPFRRAWSVRLLPGDGPVVAALRVEVEPGGVRLVTLRARTTP